MSKVPDPVWQSMNLAFYVLVEMLERSGTIDADELAGNLLRYDDPNAEALMANIRGLAETLRSRPFGPMRLGVIDGGKQD